MKKGLPIYCVFNIYVVNGVDAYGDDGSEMSN